MQIYLDEEVDRDLRQAAAAEGRSAAAVIRDALRAYLKAGAAVPAALDDPILAMAGRFGGLPADAAVDHDRYLYGPEESATPAGPDDRPQDAPPAPASVPGR